MADGRHFENRYIAISEKSSDFDEILYIYIHTAAADFELDERHVIKNEKVFHWTDSEFDRTCFFHYLLMCFLNI